MMQESKNLAKVQLEWIHKKEGDRLCLSIFSVDRVTIG